MNKPTISYANGVEDEKNSSIVRNASSFHFKEIFYVSLFTIIKGLCYTMLCTSSCCGYSVSWEVLPVLVLYYDHIITLSLSKFGKNIPNVRSKFHNTFMDSTCICTDIVGGILAFKKINLEYTCNDFYCYFVFLVWLLGGGIHCMLNVQIPYTSNNVFHGLVFVSIMSLTFLSKNNNISKDSSGEIYLWNKTTDVVTLTGGDPGTNFAYYIRTLIFLIVVISDSMCCKPSHQREIERIYAVRYGFILMCPSKLLFFVVIASLLFVGFAVHKKDIENQRCEKEKTDEDMGKRTESKENPINQLNSHDTDHCFVDVAYTKEEVIGKKQRLKKEMGIPNNTICRKNTMENSINYESLDVNEAFQLAQKLQQNNLNNQNSLNTNIATGITATIALTH